jgi:hypothetical protein
MLAAVVPATVTYAMSGTSTGLLRARRPPPFGLGPAARAADEALGCRLRQARWLVGVSPQELGAAMGVGAATVRRYEAGARRMAPKRFAAAVVFLGLPVSWYFRDDEPRRGR